MAITIIRRRRAPEVVEDKQIYVGSAGRDGAEFKRRQAEVLSQRATMLRLKDVGRLTPEEQAEAIARFKATTGISKYPPAFAAPTQAAIK